MELENGAFYWALVYGELTVVQFEDDEFWMLGDDISQYPKNIKIIAKIMPPDPDSLR